MKRYGRSWLALYAVLCCIAIGSASVAAASLEGTVFLDTNRDLSQDEREPGLANVSVSDGVTVVRTDAAGRFRLEASDTARFVFITLPSGTRALDAWYMPLSEAGPYSFPLESVDESGPLVFAQLSDIHYAPTPEEFKEGLRDRRMKILPDPILASIASEVNEIAPDFVIFAGDLAADSKYPSPELVEAWLTAMGRDYAGTFTAPVYGVVGNHDVVRDDAIGTVLYENVLGPCYYSFDVKGTHCIVLNTQTLLDSKLQYTIDRTQLEWLRRDLDLVPANAPLLIFCHEPTPDWIDTPENAELLDLLAESSITALINGHWHTNAILQREPFLEITSGAVCGAWWEGPGPDGTGFGYRIHRLARGGLDSIWRTAETPEIEVASPEGAILTYVSRLVAKAWGDARGRATARWDGGLVVPLNTHHNGLWTEATANLNVSTLPNGYHTLNLQFILEDGEKIEVEKTYYISNPEISLAEVFANPEVFQGRIVSAPRLEVRAAMGSNISANDGTKTTMIGGLPFAVARGDWIGIVGMYRPTSTTPIKAYDDLFFTLYEE